MDVCEKHLTVAKGRAGVVVQLCWWMRSAVAESGPMTEYGFVPALETQKNCLIISTQWGRVLTSSGPHTFPNVGSCCQQVLFQLC